MFNIFSLARLGTFYESGMGLLSMQIRKEREKTKKKKRKNQRKKEKEKERKKRTTVRYHSFGVINNINFYKDIWLLGQVPTIRLTRKTERGILVLGEESLLSSQTNTKFPHPFLTKH